MVHAHSCNNIPRLRWKNGKDVHVFITDTMMVRGERLHAIAAVLLPLGPLPVSTLTLLCRRLLCIARSEYWAHTRTRAHTLLQREYEEKVRAAIKQYIHRLRRFGQSHCSSPPPCLLL